MTRKIPAPLAAVVLLALLGSTPGCAPYATFPPIEVTSGLTDPTYEPFPTLMARAILYVNREHGDGGEDFRYNLPEGSTARLYQYVERRLDGAGQPQRTAGEPAIHVQSVATRGKKAEVDVIHPGADSGVYELVTISFTSSLGSGWRVTDTRPWHIRVEAPAPTWPDSEAVVSGEGAGDESP